MTECTNPKCFVHEGETCTTGHMYPNECQHYNRRSEKPYRFYTIREGLCFDQHEAIIYIREIWGDVSGQYASDLVSSEI